MRKVLLALTLVFFATMMGFSNASAGGQAKKMTSVSKAAVEPSKKMQDNFVWESLPMVISNKMPPLGKIRIDPGDQNISFGIISQFQREFSGVVCDTWSLSVSGTTVFKFKGNDLGGMIKQPWKKHLLKADYYLLCYKDPATGRYTFHYDSQYDKSEIISISN